MSLPEEKAMAALCAAHKRLDEAVRLRDRPDLRAHVLRDVAASLSAIASDLEGEAERYRSSCLSSLSPVAASITASTCR